MDDACSRVDVPVPDPDVGSSSSAGSRECWGWLCVHVCSHTGLAVLVIVYTLLGAVLFQLVEGDVTATAVSELRTQPFGDAGYAARVQRSREDCLKELWTITERLNVLYERNWTRLVHEQLRKFENNIVAATTSGSHIAGEIAEESSYQTQSYQQWSFAGALLYSVTLITTIGYGNLSPRTSLGKILTMIYATFGVPLMLLCLSSLGQLLARAVHYIYMRLCCKHPLKPTLSTTSTASTTLTERRYTHKYQRAPTSPAKPTCTSAHETSLIQLVASKSDLHHNNQHQSQQQFTPKKSPLATVNSSHTRGRCRSLSSTTVIASPARAPPPAPVHVPECSGHVALRPEPPDIEDADETDEGECGSFLHDTPSRVPLIYRADSKASSEPLGQPGDHHATGPQVSVPAVVVLVLLSCYLCLGAVVFAAWENWSFLDATYFCFITLSTIGFGDLVPGESFFKETTFGQLQMIVCSVYLVLGLVLVAMSFSLIHEEVITRCRQLGRIFGFKHQIH